MTTTTTQVWALSAGEYSDYGVICLCPTEEIANAMAEIQGTDGYGACFVESFPMIEKMPAHVTEYRRGGSFEIDTGAETGVFLWEHGDERADTTWEFDDGYDKAKQTPAVTWSWQVLDGAYRRRPGKEGYLYVAGQDRERVTKVWSDLRAQITADPAFRMVERKSDH